MKNKYLISGGLIVSGILAYTMSRKKQEVSKEAPPPSNTNYDKRKLDQLKKNNYYEGGVLGLVLLPLFIFGNAMLRASKKVSGDVKQYTSMIEMEEY